MPIYHNTGVDVATASTLILAAQDARAYVAIVNDSDTNIYLALGEAATLHNGIRLNANGGSFEMPSRDMYVGAIYGIHGGTGTKRVTIEDLRYYV